MLVNHRNEAASVIWFSNNYRKLPRGDTGNRSSYTPLRQAAGYPLSASHVHFFLPPQVTGMRPGSNLYCPLPDLISLNFKLSALQFPYFFFFRISCNLALDPDCNYRPRSSVLGSGSKSTYSERVYWELPGNMSGQRQGC